MEADAALGEGTDADVDACVELWMTAITDRDGGTAPGGAAERVRDKFAKPRVAWPVLRDADGRVVAFALVLAPGNARPQDDPDAAYLALIAVDPSLQGRGAGRRLLAAAIARMRASGHPSGLLHVLAGNARAVAMYTSAGWRPSGAQFPHSLSGLPTQTYVIDLS